jgi:hypothetical protein
VERAEAKVFAKRERYKKTFLSRILSEERSASYSRFPEIIGTHSVQY